MLTLGEVKEIFENIKANHAGEVPEISEIINDCFTRGYEAALKDYPPQPTKEQAAILESYDPFLSAFGGRSRYRAAAQGLKVCTFCGERYEMKEEKNGKCPICGANLKVV